MTVRRLLPPDAIPSIDAPVLGEAYFGAAGEEVVVVAAERVPSRRLFAFAWEDDHGPDSFCEP